MPRHDHLHAILSAHAGKDRHVTLIDGRDDQRVLGFDRLRQRALGLLGALQRLGVKAGDAMLLSLADNERFLEMFWACVLGAILPVPLVTGTTHEHRRKLFRVFAQFESAFVCMDAPALEHQGTFAAGHGLGVEMAKLRSRVVLANSLDGTGEPGRVVEPDPGDAAFIQYSSGSTGEPKGVVLTHRNLATNIAAIAEAGEFSDRDLALSWMPLSHDMGLIGFHLNMLACGASHAIMRTDLFARRPLLWLELASERRSTVLCSPNFGYQHYLGQYARRPSTELDLSAVRLIFNGAEPISAGLCRRFMSALAPSGLKASAMFPVYGLAEASLAVSFPRPGSALETVELEGTSLVVGAPVRDAAPGASRSIEFVKLGWPLPHSEIRIVDASGADVAQRVLGHVQTRGDNVTGGYHRDEAGAARLRAAGGWLDTGDLGFLSETQLVVTGRAKDIIIVNGQNFYPHDIERIAEQVAGVEVNRVAAAGVRVPGGETEALALFVVHRLAVEDFVPKALELRRVIGRQTGLEVARIVPLAHIPKTSSGKLQRYALAQAFEAGAYDAVLAKLAPLLSSEDGDADGHADGEGPGQSDAADGVDTTATVRRLLAVCRPVIPDRVLTPQTNLLDIDLSSLSLARIHEAIELEFPRRIEVTDLFDYPTLAELAAFLDKNRA